VWYYRGEERRVEMDVPNSRSSRYGNWYPKMQSGVFRSYSRKKNIIQALPAECAVVLT
jgi:hypothetical protein